MQPGALLRRLPFMDYQQQTACQNLVYLVLSVAELSGLTVDVHAHRVSMSCELS